MRIRVRTRSCDITLSGAAVRGSFAAWKKQPYPSRRVEMAVPPKHYRWTGIAAALGAAACFGSAGAGALSATQLDDLLEKLKDKGVLSDDEYQALKKAREEELLEQRAERRRQALKEAQDAEEKAKERRRRPNRRPSSTSAPESRASSSSVTCGCAMRAGRAPRLSQFPGWRRHSGARWTAGAMLRVSASAATSRTIGSTACAWTPAPTRARPG